MIVNRLKEVLLQLISPNQTSFVPGRHIEDNVIFAQEAIHSMSEIQGKQGYMILIIELEMASDWLKWYFIEETLHLSVSQILWLV